MVENSTIATLTDKREHLILIVDDLPTNLIYFEEALKTFGHKTIIAANGREAFAKAREFIPDLILSDVNMPEMDGFELCDAVKADPETNEIPLILVTAMDDREALVKGLNKGADDFLIKPVNLSELQARVRNLLLIKDYRDHMKLYTEHLREMVELRTKELKKAFDDLKLANSQLRESTYGTIQRLATAAEYKDRDTAIHIKRMSHISKLLAVGLELDKEFTQNIHYSSPMHDVGKIGTPDHILRKPGKFTQAERDIMEEHTLIGEKILADSEQPLIVMARTIAGNHHEWWDGTGYPRQIKGEDIPMAARVVAVADVYDALVTPRVYKPAWDVDRVLEHIEAESGTHFDPQVVEVLLNNSSKVLELYKAD